jgi:hypothetical protein
MWKLRVTVFLRERIQAEESDALSAKSYQPITRNFALLLRCREQRFPELVPWSLWRPWKSFRRVPKMWPIKILFATLIWILKAHIKLQTYTLTEIVRRKVILRITDSHFLGAFEKLRKETIRFVMSVRLSAWNNSVPTRRILIKFDIWWCFVNMPIKSKLHWNRTSIKGTLHEDLYAFFIISRSFLLRMKNIWNKSCRETRNAHFVFNNFFL